MRDSRFWALGFAAFLVGSGANAAVAQEHAGHATARNLSEMQFAPIPGMPGCSTGAVQSGDPATGPSIILAKVDTGCTIPWHWHSPVEHLLMVSGVARVDSKSGQPITLRTAGYAQMPSKHVHRFTCTESCVFFVYSDAAFDIHYVDESGVELTPEQALKTGVSRPSP